MPYIICYPAKITTAHLFLRLCILGRIGRLALLLIEQYSLFKTATIVVLNFYFDPDGMKGRVIPIFCFLFGYCSKLS